MQWHTSPTFLYQSGIWPGFTDYGFPAYFCHSKHVLQRKRSFLWKTCLNTLGHGVSPKPLISMFVNIIGGIPGKAPSVWWLLRRVFPANQYLMLQLSGLEAETPV